MNLDQVRQFALAVGTKVETVSGEWGRCKCPLSPWTHDSGKDSNPSFAISYGENIESAFNCYSCEAGSLHKLIMLLDGFGAKKPKYDLKQATTLWSNEDTGDAPLVFMDDEVAESPLVDKVWPESFLNSFMHAWKVPIAMEYLNARPVRQKMAHALDIRWDLSRRTVCFPVRNWQGQLVGLRGRYIESDSAARYHDYGYRGQRNKLPWYGESSVDLDKPVLMVESVFDYASAYRVYKNVLAPLTVGLSAEKCRRVRNAYEIISLFDNGKGGDKGRDKIRKGLPDSIITDLTPPASCDDPGDMTKKQLRRLLKKHIILDAQ
jgi:hypothetical protein